ncbi:hypothetical protein RVR_8374 [Actinacidiphila reveromycinica]|uniref:Uncharacterized protein n=1 Tax=Actinacidiphila reveromycinica TaxID=659352 RepID=A0A7U3UYV2_9ACTN|nr:hypothetical protein [Streptomyces sp. SN-593]BBB01117.1 hypothetical protein RVR_8374 [Streptomyces sp. SN-593]
MSDPLPPPRIHVALPGGARVTGRLLRWRQDRTGAWWAEVSLYVPAAAARQVDGEDYDGVPREPAAPTAAAYVMAADTRATPPTAEIHRVDCWMIADRAEWLRVTPLAEVEDVDPAALAAFPDTSLCGVCMTA